MWCGSSGFNSFVHTVVSFARESSSALQHFQDWIPRRPETNQQIACWLQTRDTSRFTAKSWVQVADW
jgi:hypothetical protein